YFADARRRHAYSADAVALARRRDDKVALLAALRARQLALWEPGEATRRPEIGAEILELATATRDPMATGEALAWRILDHLELGEMAVVHDALRRYRELAAACRLPHVRWHVTVVGATLAHLAGRLADAERLAQSAVGLLAPSPHNNVAMFFGVQSFLVREEEGRFGELESMATMMAEQAENLPVWRAARALLHGELGHTEAAQEAIAELGTPGFGDLPPDGNLLATYARLADACALLEAPRFAEPLLPLLAPHVDSVVISAMMACCLGSAARYAGLLAHTLGQLDAAVVYFEKALATNERIGALLQLAPPQREPARPPPARGAPGERDRAATLAPARRATAARLGPRAPRQRPSAAPRGPADPGGRP